MRLIFRTYALLALLVKLIDRHEVIDRFAYLSTLY